MRKGRNRLDPGGHAELWITPGERRPGCVRQQLLAPNAATLSKAVTTSGGGLATAPAVAALASQVPIVWMSPATGVNAGLVDHADTTVESDAAVVESIFGQSAWSSEAKSCQKPSSPSVEMLAGTDGIATDGTEEAVAPEHAVSATAATATRPMMERRTDIGHLCWTQVVVTLFGRWWRRGWAVPRPRDVCLAGQPPCVCLTAVSRSEPRLVRAGDPSAP